MCKALIESLFSTQVKGLLIHIFIKCIFYYLSYIYSGLKLIIN